jgi:hypothetical protein
MVPTRKVYAERQSARMSAKLPNWGMGWGMAVT